MAFVLEAKGEISVYQIYVQAAVTRSRFLVGHGVFGA